MKKIFLYTAAISLLAFSCNRDKDDNTVTEQISIQERSQLDNEAMTHFLETRYMDDNGVIKMFKDNDPSDDHFTKLADLNPQQLSNGTYYILRPNAQPNNGTPIHSDSVIRLMGRAVSYKSNKTEKGGRFGENIIFQSGLESGEIEVDPKYFFAPKSFIDQYNTTNGKSYDKSFFEIEGFSEALQHFQAFNKSDDEFPQLQGVIIVPSRAAFARDAHYPYTTYNMYDRSVVFNFQVYKSQAR